MARKGEWTSLWPNLLRQACRLSLGMPDHTAPEQSYFASSAILARTSIEAFVNEYVHWRGLEQALQQIPQSDDNFPRKLQVIAKLQIEGTASFIPHFRILNTLRNIIIHFNPEDSNSQDQADRCGRFFVDQDVIQDYDLDTDWQSQLINKRIAQWGCNISAQTILSLEMSRIGRVRNIETVQSIVQSAMAPLDHIWTFKGITQ